MRAPLVTLLLVLLLPATAHGGTFHVYGLGLNGGGCPAGWQAQTFSPGKLVQEDHCSSWTIHSNRDGTPLRYGDFAAASMFTAEGAQFTGFSIRSQGIVRNGMVWKMAMCRTPYADCQGQFPQSGTMYDTEFQLGSLMGGPVYARHLYAGVSCEQSSCPDSTAEGRAVDVSHTESHAVVEDYTPPGAPALSGVSAGWNSGPRALAYSASDAGSGVAAMTLTVDGSLHKSVDHACLRLPSGGYSNPVPCLLATGGEFALNESGQLADGRHALTVTSADAGGDTASTSQEFWVDNNAPAHPGGLAVTDGDAWRATNDFAVAWENPDQGAGAPVDGVYYKLGSAPTTPTDGSFVAGADIASLEHLQVPGDGDWPLYVWLRDEAGNADPAHAATASLRLDSTAPSAAFAERRADSPAEVRVTAPDAHSGLAGGQIEIRAQDAPDWRALETRREGTELAASVPDDRLPPGTYVLRASAWDAAGNRAVTTHRADGGEMLAELPLRGATRVEASLAGRASGARRARRSLRVAYGSRVWVRGALRTPTGPLPDARLAVYSRALSSGEWRPTAEVVTDGGGRYSVRLPRGGSRAVRVGFSGSALLRPAMGSARLVVHGAARLRLSPKRLRRGGTIAFVGRVPHAGATLPAAGKIIQIQYLDGRRWRPAVKLAHARRDGSFRIRYRFRRISRPTRIYFRILVPAEGGWPYATGWSRVRTAHVSP